MNQTPEEIMPTPLRCRVGVALGVLFGASTIAYYTVIAGIVNAQPSTSPFAGWVAVVQNLGDTAPEQVELRAQALVPGAPGDHPDLKYSVLACGGGTFRGLLLMGGQARLEQVEILGRQTAVAGDEEQPRVERLPNLALAQSGDTLEFGEVQVLRIAIEASNPCVSATVDQGIQLSTGVAVIGKAQGPVERLATYGGFRGSRSSQAWPKIGGFPNVADGNLGEFVGLEGIAGRWGITPQLHKKIVGGTLAARATVDMAVPPLADTSTLTWNSSKPLQPGVRLNDADDMAAAQQDLVVAGILLGIGGSLLASLLVEGLRSGRSPSPPVRTTEPHVGALNPVRQATRERTAPTDRAFTVGLVLLVYFLGRWAPRRRGGSAASAKPELPVSTAQRRQKNHRSGSD